MSTTWAIYLQVWYNTGKPVIIPNVVSQGILANPKAGIRKDLSLEAEPVHYQLVGEVTAHQGYDG